MPHAEPTAPRPGETRLLGAVFLLSGACSLVYELVWARELSRFLGNSTTAHAVVVATFMGGLALGYVLLGPLADRVRRPLRLYAGLELGISAWAAAFPALLAGGAAGVRPLLTGADPATAAGVSVALAAGTLLVPTVLMGGTLPVLTRVVARRGDAAGPIVARLYALNSAGAVLGLLAAGFVLVEHLGLRATLFGAVGVNLALAATAWWLQRGRAPEPPPAPAATPSGEADAWRPGAPSPAWVLAAAGLFGFASMALQAAWIRFFGLALGSSTYAFTLVIAAFIAGIALGAEAVRRLMGRWTGPLAALAGCALASGATLLALAPWLGRLPFDLARVRLALADVEHGFALYSAARFAIVFGVLLAPTALFGMALPLAARAATSDRIGTSTGRVFAVNTAGAVLGAALGATVLVPWLGLEGLYQATTWLLGLLGLLLLARVAAVHRRRWRLAVAGAVALVVGALLLPPGWDPRVVSAGAFRLRDLDGADFDTWRERLHRSDLVSYEDGPAATVAVLERDGDRVLMVNGKPDASTRGDMLTQVASAHLPLLLHPAPERALVIGLGSGVTAGSALRHDVSVDVVELCPSVTRASRAFDAASGAPLDDPRLTLHEDDARSFLQRSAERWDVVVSEPSNPWVEGNAGLFSVEFFETVRSRLAPGGVLAQWIHLYETDDETVRLVLRTLGRVFEHVTLWEMFPNDVLLIASREPLRPDLDALARRAAAPAVAEDLARVQVRGVAGLLSLQALGPAAVAEITGSPGPVNRDDHPILAYRAPRMLFAGGRAGLVDARDGRTAPGADPDLLLTARLVDHPLTTAEAEGLFVLHTIYPGAPRSFRDALLPALLDGSEAGFLVDVLFTLAREAQWPQAERVADRLMALAPDDPEVLHVVARARRAWQEAHPARTTTAARASVRDLLDRCLAAGDEPRGRCRTLRAQLSSASD